MSETLTGQVLIIDDDPAFSRLVQAMLRRHGYDVTQVEDFQTAKAQLAHQLPDVVLLDRHLGGQDGLALIARIHRRVPHAPVVVITADSSVDVAISSIQQGAFDFLSKPLDEGRLLATLAKAMEHHRLLDTVSQLQAGGAEDAQYEGMIGAAPSMRTIYRIIENVAPTDTNVMIQGESGTGKELVARATHQRSKRRNGPFVALNMAALPKELVESLLFGHEKGAFTGADRRRIGAAEEARGGTLFLDEIGEMPTELQPKLLRFIQERSFRRVGGSEDISADVRIVSATNRDPLEEVRLGNLRADLYYRLNVVPIYLPPLRERREDIPLLAMHALKQFALKHGKRFERIDAGVMMRLQSLPWPGNVRQLIHTIERMVVLNDAPSVTLQMLPADLEVELAMPADGPVEAGAPADTVDRVADRAAAGASSEPGAAPQVTPAATALDEPESTSDAKGTQRSPVEAAMLGRDNEIRSLADLEQMAIERAIHLCNGSAAQAARHLGISEATIYRKIKQYGHAPPRASRG